MVFTNPADIYDPRTSFVNPAVISYQGGQIALGIKAYHVGFIENNKLGFRNGYVSATSPYLIKGKIGLGFNGQYLNTPLYQQTNFSLLLSRKFWRLLSVGIQFNIFTKSYDRSKFDLLHSDDPVFASGTTKCAFSIGSALLFVPIPSLYLAVGMEHINRPNVALSSLRIYQPRVLSFGIKYIYGSLSSSVYFKKLNGQINPFFEIEPNFSNNWNLKLGYGMKTMRMDGLIKVGAGISLGYGYEYPFSSLHGASFGSCRLSMIYNIDDVPQLPKQIQIPSQRIIFEMPENSMKLKPRFVVYSSVNALEIVQKQLTRIIDDSLTNEEIASLTYFELGTLDSNKTSSPLYFKTKSLDAYYPGIKRVGRFTELYKTTLDTIICQLRYNKEIKAEIISTKGVTNRAAGIQNYLMTADGVIQKQVEVVAPICHDIEDSLKKYPKISKNNILPKEALTVISHESTRFYITPIYLNDYDDKWSLSIYSSSGKIVKEFYGTGEVPEKINWDWKNEKGHFIEPDLYYYTFKWIDENGEIQLSNPRIIDVQKIKRNLTITITKNKKFIGNGVKKYGLRLNR